MNGHRVGIISLYQGSVNCGGLLQAYALCTLLSSMGYKAEQICFEDNTKELKKKKISTSLKFIHPMSLIKGIFRKIGYKIAIRMSRVRIIKSEAFRNEMIPHSNVVYNPKTIGECNAFYDIFVTGSDQVWNPEWFHSVYMLSFADEEKTRISYAASMGISMLKERDELLFSKHIKNVEYISVRESDSKNIIRRITDRDIDVVLDPTLMLSVAAWDRIACKKLVNKEYVFCYFLGLNKKAKRLAYEYAKKHNLSAVIIPFLVWDFRMEDFIYSNKRIKSGGPQEFISLIKHSRLVFTDSFHATVFSCMYNKEFFVFDRIDNDSGGSRIRELTEIFDCNDRYIKEKSMYTLEYISSVENSKAYDNVRINELRRKSMEYLNKALESSQ